MILAYWQISVKRHHRLQEPIYASLTGIIKTTKPNNRGGTQLTLNVTAPKQYVKLGNIRITTNHPQNQSKLLIGSKVKVRAKLMPPPQATITGGYDFAFHSYFNKIGATGYAVKPLKISRDYQQSTSIIANIRQQIYVHLQQAMNKNEAGIISAIMLGESGGINPDIMQNMRYSGISHILCVSGLHLSLVAGISLLACRVLLNCSNFIAFNFNIKLLSSACSLLTSFIYLMLTGQQIAATRAFIMTSFMIAAFTIGRGNHPMRSLCVAASFILFLHPEFALHPSFQLSFVAVISLVSGFELFQRYQSKILQPIGGVASKIKLFIVSNLYSSLIASLATAPIVIYHFHIISNYTLLANLLAIPLMSFYIMPLVLLSLFLMPLGLDHYILQLVGYGTHKLAQIAAFTTAMPFPIVYFGAISGKVLMLFICGFLLLSLLRSKLRSLGVPIILIAVILMINTPKPDVIFNPTENIIAIKRNDALKIYGKKMSKYVTNYWSSWFGFEKAYITNQELSHANHCINIKQSQIAILYRPAQPGFCTHSSLNIHATNEAHSNHHNILTYDTLQNIRPSISIYCQKKHCYIVN